MHITNILTFDRHNNFSDTQQIFTSKMGSTQKRKIHVELEVLHLQFFFFFSHKTFAKEKQTTFQSSYGL